MDNNKDLKQKNPQRQPQEITLSDEQKEVLDIAFEKTLEDYEETIRKLKDE